MHARDLEDGVPDLAGDGQSDGVDQVMASRLSQDRNSWAAPPESARISAGGGGRSRSPQSDASVRPKNRRIRGERRARVRSTGKENTTCETPPKRS
jgi:hypothetical protein